MDLCQQTLQTNGDLFSNFEFVLDLMTKKQNIFKQIARLEYWSNINVLCINGQWICLNELYKLVESFKFQVIFQNFGRKLRSIQKNSEAWILIKFQCVIYQWIRVNELYKLMESFFQILNSFSNFR